MIENNGMRQPTEGEKRAQALWERSAVYAMDKGWDPEAVGLSMLVAAQKLLSQMYSPDQMAFVLGRLAYEWEKAAGCDPDELGVDQAHF